MRKLFFVVMMTLLYSTLTFASDKAVSAPANNSHQTAVTKIIPTPINSSVRIAASQAKSKLNAIAKKMEPASRSISRSTISAHRSGKIDISSLIPAPGIKNNSLANNSNNVAVKDNNSSVKNQIRISISPQLSDQLDEQKYTSFPSSCQPNDEIIQQWEDKQKAAAIKIAQANNIETISRQVQIRTGSLRSHFIVEEVVQEAEVSTEKLKKEIIFKKILHQQISKEAYRYAHEKGHSDALKNAAIKIEQEIAVIEKQISSINAVAFTACQEIKKMIADCIKDTKKSEFTENKRKSRLYNKDRKNYNFEKMIAFFNLIKVKQDFLDATTFKDRQAAMAKLIIAFLNYLSLDEKSKERQLVYDNENTKNSDDLIEIAELVDAAKKDNENIEDFDDSVEDDFDHLVELLENIDCEEFLEKKGRVIATSAELVFCNSIFYTEAVGAAGPIGLAILVSSLIFENREFFIDVVMDFLNSNKQEYMQNKQLRERMAKDAQELKAVYDKVVDAGFISQTQADNTFLIAMYEGYCDGFYYNLNARYDPHAKIIVTSDKYGNQSVFIISGDYPFVIRKVDSSDATILQYLFSQKAIDDANKVVAQQQQAIIDTRLTKVEKNLPSVEKYNKLTSHKNLLPVDGAGLVFVPAYSQDGRILRDKKGAYYDVYGNKWVFNKAQKVWVVSIFADGRTIFVPIPKQDVTLGNDDTGPADMNQAKNNNNKKPKQDNKKPDDKDPKDPKDPKKPDDKYTYKNGKIDDSNKHHPNSPDGVGKSPRDAQKALDDSFDVKDHDQRIAVQDKKIIIFQESAPGQYHGYIVENYQSLEPFIKQALLAAGLIKNIKTGKLV